MKINSSSNFVPKYIILVSIAFMGLIIYRLTFISSYVQNDTEYDLMLAKKNELAHRNSLLKEQISDLQSYQNIIQRGIENDYLTSNFDLNVERLEADTTIAFNNE